MLGVQEMEYTQHSSYTRNDKWLVASTQLQNKNSIAGTGCLKNSIVSTRFLKKGMYLTPISHEE